MDLISMAFELLKGLSINVLITIVSSVLTVIAGVIFVIGSKHLKGVRVAGRILGVLTEAHVPILLLFAVSYNIYFSWSPINRMLVSIFVLTICFMGYIPARYNENYSIIKNIAVNTVGLISAVFKWSFCAGVIGANDMLHAAHVIASRTYDPKGYIIVAVIAFAIVLLLEAIKAVLEKILK